jgi:hypothetical protein
MWHFLAVFGLVLAVLVWFTEHRISKVARNEAANVRPHPWWQDDDCMYEGCFDHVKGVAV